MATSVIKADNYSLASKSFNFGGKAWNFYKSGKIIIVSAPQDISSASAGQNAIGTLPVEYRPSNAHYFAVQNASSNQTGKFLMVTASGEVKFYTPTAITSATNCGIAGCYVSES